MKAIARFSAVLIALLSIGIHGAIVAILMLTGYKLTMLFIAFLLPFVSIFL
ncbi:hypothetical protein [Cardinium endosymbiont of Oedothorax gibbosus]|uniref:hypothetical protein n=1 Tax=Cardinium endosymbiont of Oedothorax gibbosus TaxID=931101 RepID=UPI0020250A44|nr:hypothetical protein [Cardinium endosymbiont of Oedothorax gibbosus]